MKYDSFDDLPKHLVNKMKEFETLTLFGKKWKILDIDKDLRVHGE
ncbi:hypothetical protein [Nitrosopumilus sp.]|nr:hypothetical protein [Nitrosopumilus sp.]